MKRPIAFYLPQFHPIPENDEWWGKGFTEWRNVARGKPQFEGHIQPNSPGELGHYDLRVPEVQRQQVDLAKEYGIHGFCFYYYWFEGKRLLELPLNRFIQDSSIDFPFCICWANETWSRRWDGSESEILIEQVYHTKYAKQLFDDFAVYLDDPRYIEIDGKKLLLIYRPDHIPNVTNYIKIWRELAAARGWTLLVTACLTFGGGDPTRLGFDAGVQFPPHGVIADEGVPGIAANADFKGKLYSYPSVVAGQITDPAPSFPLFRGVMPSWDNTARRLENAYVYANHSPELFSIWLNDAFTKTYNDTDGNSYVFINAWNEWAEGAYLEPDLHHGRARLEAVRHAVNSSRPPEVAVRTLMELAKVVGGSSADIIRQCASALSDTLDANNTILKQLRSIAMKERSPYELFTPVLPFKDLLLAPPKAVFLPGAIGAVDRIGSLEFENGIQVYPGKTLFISGWILPPSPEVVASPTHIVVILSNSSGETVFFESERFTDRLDVADFMNGWPTEKATRSGFELSLSVDGLAADSYTLKVGVACETIIYTLPGTRQFVISMQEDLDRPTRLAKPRRIAAE
jgi:hypothetical protein